MTQLALYLRAFDDAWNHRFESLNAALEGVTEETAFFQHASYDDVPEENGWPKPGSIAWQVAHVTDYKDVYAENLERIGGSTVPPDPPRIPGTTLTQLKRDLAEAHARERRALEALADVDLDGDAGNDMSVAEYLAMILRHDVWHASQIAVATRLARR